MDEVGNRAEVRVEGRARRGRCWRREPRGATGATVARGGAATEGDKRLRKEEEKKNPGIG